MPEKTVMLVCEDRERMEQVRRWVEESGIDRFVCLGSAAEARRVGGARGFDLTLYYLEEWDALAGVDAALWSVSTTNRPAPVVVLSDRYDEGVALTLFQMGVTDYLGLVEHGARLPELIGRLLGFTDESPHRERPARLEKAKEPAHVASPRGGRTP